MLLFGKKFILENVKLIRLSSQHIDFIHQCRTDPLFQNNYNIFQGDSLEVIKEDLKRSESSPLETNKIDWIVVKNDKPVGLSSLVNLDMKNSRAELLVGFPNKISHSASLESTILVIEFAFCTLGLKKLYSYVYVNNQNGQRNTLHLGFEQEGYLKSHIFNPSTGERLDLYVNAYFPETFFSDQRIIKMAKRLLGRRPRQ